MIVIAKAAHLSAASQARIERSGALPTCARSILERSRPVVLGTGRLDPGLPMASKALFRLLGDKVARDRRTSGGDRRWVGPRLGTAHDGSSPRGPGGVSRKIVIINGHPDTSHGRFAAALVAAYLQGAFEAGHESRRFDVGDLNLAPMQSMSLLQIECPRGFRFCRHKAWRRGPAPAAPPADRPQRPQSSLRCGQSCPDHVPFQR